MIFILAELRKKKANLIAHARSNNCYGTYSIYFLPRLNTRCHRYIKRKSTDWKWYVIMLSWAVLVPPFVLACPSAIASNSMCSSLSFLFPCLLLYTQKNNWGFIQDRRGGGCWWKRAERREMAKLPSMGVCVCLLLMHISCIFHPLCSPFTPPHFSF